MASDPSVSACNDLNAIFAVVNHGSGAGPGTCNNGNNALAVVVPPRLETNSITQSNVCPPPSMTTIAGVLTTVMD